jgi:hypothetical protein
VTLTDKQVGGNPALYVMTIHNGRNMSAHDRAVTTARLCTYKWGTNRHNLESPQGNSITREDAARLCNYPWGRSEKSKSPQGALVSREQASKAMRVGLSHITPNALSYRQNGVTSLPQTRRCE